MNRVEQIDAFSTELWNLVERFAKEFELTYAETIGVLHLQIFILEQEAVEEIQKENNE